MTNIQIISVIFIIAISVLNHREQQIDIDLLQEKVWHLEALIELEDFENDREPNALHSLVYLPCPRL